MKFAKAIIASCVAAGLATGCGSIGNSAGDLGNLSQEEWAGLEEMRQEVQAGLEEASTELYGALDEFSAEFYGALDEASAEMQEEGADWIREMMCGGEERPRRVLWRQGGTEAEIGDREEFADSLKLEDWKASTESTEGLEQDSVYTIQWKKSVGLLDGWKDEYVDMGTVTAYKDSNLVSARICVMDGILGKLMGKGGDVDGWLVFVYEVPEDVAGRLRGGSDGAE